MDSKEKNNFTEEAKKNMTETAEPISDEALDKVSGGADNTPDLSQFRVYVNTPTSDPSSNRYSSERF